jgi:hypothetical protein
MKLDLRPSQPTVVAATPGVSPDTDALRDPLEGATLQEHGGPGGPPGQAGQVLKSEGRAQEDSRTRDIAATRNARENPLAVGGTHTRVTLDPARARGSALQVGAIPAKQYALDALSTTQLYLHEADQDPDASEEELWTRAVHHDANRGGRVMGAAPAKGEERAGPQLPPVDNTRVDLPGPKPGKLAVVIGNQRYASLDELPGAGRDAAMMASRYTNQGYAVAHLKDQNAAQLAYAVRTVLKGRQAGDEVVVYYAGHGVADGLLGVQQGVGGQNDILPHAALNQVSTQAVSEGWHAQVIVDACESASAVADVEAALGPLAKDKQTEILTLKLDEAGRQHPKTPDALQSGGDQRWGNLTTLYKERMITPSDSRSIPAGQ